LSEKRQKKKSGSSSLTTASSFKSKAQCENLKNKFWSIRETELFYELLTQFGTSFDIIAVKLSETIAAEVGGRGKTRKQVMLKYNHEDKLNSARIDAALSAKFTKSCTA
jgi:hypothetical protein